MMTTSVIENAKNKSVPVVWVILVATTALSWWLGDGHGPARPATVGILIAAFVKVFLVGRYFMELKDAPRALQAAFGGWCVVVCSALIALYLSAA